MNKRFRRLHILYLVLAVIAWLILHNNTETPLLQLSAEIAELLALIIALTEIFVLSLETEELKTRLNSLQVYKDVINISNLITVTKSGIMEDNYHKSLIRFQIIKEIMYEIIPDGDMQNKSSSKRELYEKICAYEDVLLMNSHKVKISGKDEMIKFLTILNTELLPLMTLAKNAII